MSSITTDSGLSWLVDFAAEQTDVAFQSVAVGSGDTQGSLDQSALNDELYRSDISESNSSVESTTDVGEIIIKITVSGGTEVPAGSTITEIALFLSDDTIFYLESEKNVTVESGERITLETSTVVENK